MMKRYPFAIRGVFRAVNQAMKIVIEEIKEVGPEEAHKRFWYRSEAWITGHDGLPCESHEEAVAIAAFAAALAFINVLWQTGEIFNDTK